MPDIFRIFWVNLLVSTHDLGKGRVEDLNLSLNSEINEISFISVGKSLKASGKENDASSGKTIAWWSPKEESRG